MHQYPVSADIHVTMCPNLLHSLLESLTTSFMRGLLTALVLWATRVGWPSGALQRDPAGILLIPACQRARRRSWSKVAGIWDGRPLQAAREPHVAQREWSSRDLQLHCFVCLFSWFVVAGKSSQARVIFSLSQSPGGSSRTSSFPSRK